MLEQTNTVCTFAVVASSKLLKYQISLDRRTALVMVAKLATSEQTITACAIYSSHFTFKIWIWDIIIYLDYNYCCFLIEYD